MATGPQASPDSVSQPSSISSTLLERIKANRPEAWRRLVDLYGPVIYRWCRLAGVPKDDAADVVQEVFAAVTKHIGGFHRDRPGAISVPGYGPLRTVKSSIVFGAPRPRCWAGWDRRLPAALPGPGIIDSSCQRETGRNPLARHPAGARPGAG